MAYVSKENKQKLAPGIKAVLKKFGVKGTISVNNHSTLVVTLSEGTLDLIGDANRMAIENARGFAPYEIKGHFDVNQYWIKEHHSGECAEFLTELYGAMSVGNHDRSDIQIDHFDIGWYTSIKVGRYDKPYVYTGA